jgi:murein DD-endopeptidase MepM/ murein hydrolase activator NlpD
LAAYANFGGEDAYSFWFESEDQEVQGYYDENARPMKKAFLKAPVEFTRISSRFNLNRFHPILKRVKAHLGTDYAAPQGTPILAIADGVVVEATRSGGNGIYVKIKHDAVYTSQYLHMCRHAQGIRPGVHVGQGQVIGYVGSTGLATGPHVCFRFWKNGQQVDFLQEKLPRPEPMTGPHVEAFFHVRDSLKQALDAMALPPAP